VFQCDIWGLPSKHKGSNGKSLYVPPLGSLKGLRVTRLQFLVEVWGQPKIMHVYISSIQPSWEVENWVYIYIYISISINENPLKMNVDPKPFFQPSSKSSTVKNWFGTPN